MIFVFFFLPILISFSFLRKNGPGREVTQTGRDTGLCPCDRKVFSPVPLNPRGEDPEVDGRGKAALIYKRASTARGLQSAIFSARVSLHCLEFSPFLRRQYSAHWPTTSGERWPQSLQPLLPSPRSWFPLTSKRDCGELEALASPQGELVDLASRAGWTGGWNSCPPLNKCGCSERVGLWRSPTCQELAH